MKDVSKDAVVNKTNCIFRNIFHPLFLTGCQDARMPGCQAIITLSDSYLVPTVLFHILHNNIVSNSVAVWLEEFGDLLLREIEESRGESNSRDWEIHSTA